MKHAMLLSMLAMLLAANAGAQTSPKQLPETANIRGLLLSAIDSKNGTAEAWLTGPMAVKLKNETKAPPNTRVKVSVSTLQVFRPGCKRLRMTLAMPTHKMLTVKGTMEMFQMYYDLNLCRDGQPPQVSPVGLGEAR